MELALVGGRVVDVVRDHDGQPDLIGERRGLRDEPVVVGEQVM